MVQLLGFMLNISIILAELFCVVKYQCVPKFFSVKYKSIEMTLIFKLCIHQIIGFILRMYNFAFRSTMVKKFFYFFLSVSS